MKTPIFPTPENYPERKELALAQHLDAAELCQQGRELEALPILRRVVSHYQALQAEQRDGAIVWRYILALHSLGISAAIADQIPEAASAAATALYHARRSLPHATSESAATVRDEIAKLEKLTQTVGQGVAFIASDGGAWPYGE